MAKLKKQKVYVFDWIACTNFFPVKSNIRAKVSSPWHFLYSVCRFLLSVIIVLQTMQFSCISIHFVFDANTLWVWNHVSRVGWVTLSISQHCFNKQECVNIGTWYFKSSISFDQTPVSVIKCTVNIYSVELFYPIRNCLFPTTNHPFLSKGCLFLMNTNQTTAVLLYRYLHSEWNGLCS